MSVLVATNNVLAPVASTILGSVWFAGPNYTGIVESWMMTWGPPVPTFGCWMEQPRPGSNHPDASNILYRCWSYLVVSSTSSTKILTNN